NGDGVPDLITASGAGIEARVRAWDGATARLIGDLTPFPGYQGGLWVAVGHVNRDGVRELAIGTDLGNVPHVKVFDASTFQERASFYAYDPGFVGGVRVAMGDLNGDGYDDLVTAPGFGAGSDIAMFDGRTLAPGVPTTRLFNDFYMYDPSMIAGVNLTVADTDADGYADIITGPAAGPAHLRVVSGRALTYGQGPVLLASTILWAGEVSGLRVGGADADGDGRTDLLLAPGRPNAGRVGVMTASDLNPPNFDGIHWLDPLPGLSDGVFVA
ncbi:MAG: hypothetical protein K2V38_00945, partial [Gemmataceae bacterium]|nr:hypothetical protein [Gemmataceae bacterium]